MDIEALVTKYERLIPAGVYTLAEGIRVALTEADVAMTMEHKFKMLQVEAAHAIELRAYEATVQNLEQRIRELEAQSASVGIIDSNCGYLTFAGRVCNKCGRIHDGGKSVPVVGRPDCGTCENRGRVNGLSQETYCDGCVFQESWRSNHYAATAGEKK